MNKEMILDFNYKFYNLQNKHNSFADVLYTENNMKLSINLCSKLNKFSDSDSNSLNSISHTSKVILNELKPKNNNYIEKLFIILYFLSLKVVVLNQAFASAGSDKNGDDDKISINLITSQFFLKSNYNSRSVEDKDDEKSIFYTKSTGGGSKKRRRKNGCEYFPECGCQLNNKQICYEVAILGGSVTHLTPELDEIDIIEHHQFIETMRDKKDKDGNCLWDDKRAWIASSEFSPQKESILKSESLVIQLLEQNVDTYRFNDLYARDWLYFKLYRKDTLIQPYPVTMPWASALVYIPDRILEAWKRFAITFDKNKFVPFHIYYDYAERLVPEWSIDLLESRRESIYFTNSLKSVPNVFRSFGCPEEFFLELFFSNFKSDNIISFLKLKNYFWNRYYKIEDMVENNLPIDEYFINARHSRPIPIINKMTTLVLFDDTFENSIKKTKK